MYTAVSHSLILGMACVHIL